MKYGLREENELYEEEEVSNWKLLVENELKNLRREVAEGKQQFDKLNEKLKLNSSTSTCELKGRNGWWLPAGGTTRSSFKATCIDFNSLEIKGSKYINILFMEEYSNWSYEELRLADYKIAKLPQYSRFTKIDPNWPYQNSVTTRPAEPSTYYQNKKCPDSYETSPESARFHQAERKPQLSESKVLKKYEQLLDKVVSELETVNKSMKSVDSRLSAVEANMSALSYQVSVMDSRLHAVDMFVTMGNFEKRWQTFKPRLNSLESTPVQNEGILCEKGISSQLYQTLTHDKNSAKPRISSSTPVAEFSVKDCKLPLNIQKTGFCHPTPHLVSSTPPLNKESLIENANKTYDSSNKVHVPVSTSVHNTGQTLNVTETINPDSPNDCSYFDSNNRKSDSEISLTQAVTNFYCNWVFNSVKEENSDSFNTSSFVETADSTTVSMTNRSETAHDSGESCKVEHSSSPGDLLENDNLDKLDNGKPECITIGQEISSDIEEEYVIVQKRDLGDVGCFEEENQCISSSALPSVSLNDSQLCCNVTEYLEIHVGKKKDEIYQFNFKAKPESPDKCFQLFPSGTTSQNELKIRLSMKNDFNLPQVANKSFSVRQRMLRKKNNSACLS